jgi:hypothetical protein
MTPALMLVNLGGIVVLMGGFLWLLYRLGHFDLTAGERRTWIITGAIVLVSVVLVAFFGRSPSPLPLLLSAGALGIGIWSWRSGRFRLDAVPADSRAEYARRREWMRTHVGLLVGLSAAFTILMVVWSLAVVLVTRSG